MATHLEIEVGVPLPLARGRRMNLPLDKMAVGDSVFVPCPAQEVAVFANRAAVSARTWSRRHTGGTAKFVYRTMEGGFRIWRLV